MVMPMTDERVHALLPGVSRTFAISIAVLRGDLALDVAMAYLVCRLLDTVEDDVQIPAERRRRILMSLAEAIVQQVKLPEALADLAGMRDQIQATPVEHELLAEAESLFSRLNAIPPARSASIKSWSCEMAQGMADFVSDTPGESVRSMQDLERYCHAVAGTVGGMLTDLFIVYGCGINRKKQVRLKQFQEAFGRGLQLVNIIKDCGKDWKLGRSFIPRDFVTRARLSRADEFFSNGNELTREILTPLVEKASTDLDDAVRYVRILPRRMWRARLFCIYPLVFARASLALLANNLDRIVLGEPGPRITRGQVRRLMLVAFPAALSNFWLRFVGRKRHSEKRSAASLK